MASTSASRSIATLTALSLAAGTLTLIASARQSPPSAAGAKKAATVAQTPPAGKQPTLPGFDRPGAPKSPDLNPISDPQKQVGLVIHEPDLNSKSNIYKGKDFVYTEGETRVTGASAVYNKVTLELDAQGNLDLEDPKHHVTGDKSHVDRKKKLAVITGNVVIILKPSPPAPEVAPDSDSAKQRQHPVTITCDRVDDYYKKDFILLNGHLIFKQTITKDDGKSVERTMTAEHAEYDGKTNKLHLFQPVKAFDSEGQTINFEKDAFVGTKEGEETLTSPGKSDIHFNLENTSDPDEKPADARDTKPPVAPPAPMQTPK